MSHRKDAMDEEEHKSEAAGMMRWLLTYSDMITLLLGLFIIIAGASKADTAKYNILASQAERVFGAGKSTIFQGQNGSLKGGTGVMPFIGRKESKQAEQPAGVSVVETNVGTKITFSSGILFSAGEADLQPKAKNIIDTIYKMYLNNPNNTIVIKGHTDNRPISSAVYPSNWELSTGRAGSVARYIISKFGVQPSRIVTSGLADTNPVATNDTEMGRAKNRRVEIWLLRGQANQVMNEMRDAASTATDVFGKGTFQ